MAVLHIKFTIVFTTLYYLTRVHAYIVFKSFYGNRFNQDKALNGRWFGDQTKCIIHKASWM